MILALQVIVFILIIIWSLKYISSYQELVSHPFSKKEKIVVSGMQKFLLLILATGILQLGGFSAMRLLGAIILVLIAILKDSNKQPFSFTVFTYILFLLWLICAIVYSPVKDYGVRVFLKYLYPFLILLLAAKVTTSPPFAYTGLKIILKVGVLGALSLLVLSRIPILNQISGGLLWWGPAILDFLGVAIAIVLAYYTMEVKKRYIWLLPLFVLPCVLGVNRTGLLVVTITIAIFSLVRYNIRSVPYLVLAGGIFLGSVLYIPEIREKMFKKELSTEYIVENRESLTTDDIDSSGRFAMWEWSLKRFYEGKELTGSGLGVLQEVFYSLNHPFGRMRIVHNDYVQLLCDTGLIGLILYALVFLSMAIHSVIVFYSRNQFTVRLLAIISVASIAGMAASLYTDNAVNYSLMTLGYPFAIYGMMLGLKKNEKLRAKN